MLTSLLPAYQITGLSTNLMYTGVRYERVLIGSVRSIVTRREAERYPDAVNALLGVHSLIRVEIVDEYSVNVGTASSKSEEKDQDRPERKLKQTLNEKLRNDQLKLHHDQLLSDAILELKMSHLVSIKWYDLLQKDDTKGLKELWPVKPFNQPF